MKYLSGESFLRLMQNYLDEAKLEELTLSFENTVRNLAGEVTRFCDILIKMSEDSS